MDSAVAIDADFLVVEQSDAASVVVVSSSTNPVAVQSGEMATVQVGDESITLNIGGGSGGGTGTAGVTTFNGRDGDVILANGDVIDAISFTPEDSAKKGAADGYASLDAGGKVPADQLPGAFQESTDDLPEGVSHLYFTYQRVRDAVLTGLSTATGAAIAATDSVLTALGKLQAQITTHIGSGGSVHSAATGSAAGFMSASDKTKLDGLSIGSSVQAWDADLDAIAGLSGASGLLRKTGTNSWALAAAIYTSEVPALDWSKITTGKPTTLGGYGITDGINVSAKGVANGVATLDASGLIPSTQLPSYVDDVLEYAAQASFPTTGESGKIYVALDTGKIYRWGGSSYIEISAGGGTSDLALKLANARAIAMTGDVSWSVNFDGSGNVTAAGTLANSGVTAGSYGSATAVPAVTIDAKGRVIAVTLTPISFPVTSVSGKAGAVTLAKADVGLENVDNESKSTMFTSPTFTGTTTLPMIMKNVGGTGDWTLRVQDGMGRINYYWNTYGGTAPTLQTANEDAFRFSMSVDGPVMSFHAFDGSTSAAGTAITWTEVFRASFAETTAYFKGQAVWHSGNDGAGSGLDADTLDGLQPDSGATANTIVRRDANGDFSGRYVNSQYVNMSHAAAARTTDTVFYSSTDNYIRKNTAAGFRTALDVYSKSETSALLSGGGGGSSKITTKQFFLAQA